MDVCNEGSSTVKRSGYLITSHHLYYYTYITNLIYDKHCPCMLSEIYIFNIYINIVFGDLQRGISNVKMSQLADAVTLNKRRCLR